MNLKLTLNEKQSKVLINALDAYARLHTGQIYTVMLDVMRLHEQREFNRDAVKKAAKELGNCFASLGHNVTPSILDDKVPEEARIAWDIKEVVKDSGSQYIIGKEPRPKVEKLQ